MHGFAHRVSNDCRCQTSKRAHHFASSISNGDNGALLLSSGLAYTQHGFIGNNSGSNGTATISGGNWGTTDSVTVGYSGTGILNITGSGSVTVQSGANHLFLAQNAGSVGTLNLGTGGTAGALSALDVIGGTRRAAGALKIIKQPRGIGQSRRDAV